MSEWIPPAEWATIVEHVPIVSVDLVVLAGGGVVLGRRENDPAKGEWFVPGGRVWKFEPLEDTVHRVAEAELGVGVEIIERLGAYEHFYKRADVPDVDEKHYVANGFVVETDGSNMHADDQHGDVRVFENLPDSLYKYVAAYLRNASAVEYHG